MNNSNDVFRDRVSILPYLKKISLPKKSSHKGQNGKLLVIGGSTLFHAASKWSLDVASKFVDMVFYASIPENNQILKQIKKNFWNGIVIDRQDIDNYIAEADCILIGPGMTRDDTVSNCSLENLNDYKRELESYRLTTEEWNTDTKKIVDVLLNRYPQKKWVIDAGALQMVEPTLLNQNCVVTPHYVELETVLSKITVSTDQKNNSKTKNQISLKRVNQPQSLDDVTRTDHFRTLLQTGTTILLKGEVDVIFSPELMSPSSSPSSSSSSSESGPGLYISGGNAGMTKGGTGDVLAGFVAAMYCTHTAQTAAVIGSYVNKKAAEQLYLTVGPYFNASDLVQQVPKTFWQLLQIVQ